MLQSLLLGLALLVAPLAQAGDAGVTATDIRLGASAVLSGPLGAQTQAYGEGARLYFESVNASGGVHGRKISYTTLDDGFDVQKAVANTRQLIDEQQVFMIFNNTGTAHTAAILPLLAESRTVAFGPVTGASAFRDKFNPLLFHVRAGYAQEARAIVNQSRQIGMTRVAVIYQDDGFGQALLDELRKAAAAEKQAFVAEIKVDPRQPDFGAAAQALAAQQPQAVVLATAGTTFTHLVKAMRAAGLRPSVYGFSVASLDVINRELKDQARGIILAQIMPSLRNPTIPVVTEYLKLLRQKSPEASPSASQFEGFVHAKLLVEGLRRAGRNLGTDSFIKAMESAGDIRFGPFSARYAPDNHNGSAYVELAIIDNAGQLRY